MIVLVAPKIFISLYLLKYFNGSGKNGTILEIFL